MLWLPRENMPVENATGWSDLLQSQKVTIPEYQREYEWNKNLLKSLWDDLAECIDQGAGNAEYFLGNIMAHLEYQTVGGLATNWYLVDGQQRLVSLTLIAAVVRDNLVKYDEHRSAYDIQDQLLWPSKDQEPKLVPRPGTGNLLRPAQLPLRQSIRFQFEADVPHGTNEVSAWRLKTPTIATFFIHRDVSKELAPGITFTPVADIVPGERLTQLLGRLVAPEGISKDQPFTLKTERDQESIISQQYNGRWPVKGLRIHYKTNIPKWFRQRYIDKSEDWIIQDLKFWKNLLINMKFTTTVFQDEDDAIYYFGKLNDSDSSLQLNPGDLMRHFVITTSRREPSGPYDELIRQAWEPVEEHLKDREKTSAVPEFMRTWLIATGQRTTEKKAYAGLKQHARSKFLDPTSGEWRKHEFHQFMQEFAKSSSEFSEIRFPEHSHTGTRRMLFDVLNRNYKQHRPFFLSGAMSFLRNDQNPAFNRLVNIFEYLIVKGVVLPGIAGDDVVSIASNDVYSWADRFCEKIHRSSNGYQTKIPDGQVTELLDSLAGKVVSACKAVWLSSPDWEWNEDILPEKLAKKKFTQNQSKLLLTRLELFKAGSSKHWDPSVQVEHVAPKSWNALYNDPSHGGGFELETDQDGKLLGDSIGEYKKYLDMIGNKTLLNPTTNNNLDNLSFLEKKRHDEHGYARQTAWQITGELLDFDVWGPSQILERSKEILVQVVNIYSEDFVS